MLKALVYLIYPIVIFVGGPINDKSRFCQLSGFISVVGIEASGMSFNQPRAINLALLEHFRRKSVVASISIA